MVVKAVTNMDQFNAELSAAGDELVAVDFYADWCGPCKTISPKFEAMSSSGEFQQCVFLKVNVDEAEEITEQYGVSAMPTFLFFKNGQKIDIVVGASEANVREAIKKNT